MNCAAGRGKQINLLIFKAPLLRNMPPPALAEAYTNDFSEWPQSKRGQAAI